MKLVPGPLPPIPTTTSGSLPLGLPFSPDLLWGRYPLSFPSMGGSHPSSPLWDYKSQLPGSLSSDPRMWSREDVAIFLRWAEREFDLQPIDMDMFQMNGKAICLLTRTDLSERAPGSGDVLHNVLQILMRDANNLRLLPNSPITPTSRHAYPLSPHPTSAPTTPSWNLPITSQPSSDYHNSHAASLAAHIMAQSNSVTLSPAPSVDSQSGSPNHPDAPMSFGHSIFSANGGSSSNGSNSNPSDSDEDEKFIETKNGYVGSPPNTPGYMNMPQISFLTPRSPKQMENLGSPGIYKREFFGSAEGSEPNTNGRLLWDFLQQLLNDPAQRYTSYIAWKNRETGVFKIVDPPALAKLWGIQKNHLSMNYDKMSRALRYYYRVNILRKVQGERHCYQFLRNPAELKNIKNISLLRQQMSPTATKSTPAQIQIIPQITIKPEPMEQQPQQQQHEQPPPMMPAAVPSHIKLSEQVQKQSIAALAQNVANSQQMNEERLYHHSSQPEDKPTDLSMDGPTDLSSGSKKVSIVCSPDQPPFGGGGR
ncbi:ets DNA-binding protein pokkuri isoform X2 [Anthonomus grandis grandis]|nr:ets DNA-binding protein pokkuri isoform X2 [Anthonomus grandis grandis]XP_050299950.1 ets DNA-binding protein pokkuri isoform X2 [Anthonomus grandis grandis]